MDVREIRAAFAVSESLPQRIRAFRDERLGRILAGQTPVDLAGKKRLVLHLLPVSAFDRPVSHDLSRRGLLHLTTPSLVRLGAVHVADKSRFNIDGFVLYEQLADPSTSKQFSMGYVQFFRTGAMEVTATLDLPGNFSDWLPQHLGAKLIDYFEHYFEWFQKVVANPPVYLLMSLLNVKGTSLYLRSEYLPITIQATGSNQPFDREHLFLPDTLIEDFDMTPAEMLRPALDGLWQAGGWPSYFDDRNR